MKKWLKKMIMMTGLILAVWSVHSAGEAPGEPKELYARSAVLTDGSSGRVLFGKNENERLPMASTTKIMTCILVLERAKPEDTVTVSPNAAAQPEVRLGAAAGEQFRLEDLLYSLMLESHNDTAVMLAEHVAGSVEEFAALMNLKAQELGCTQTHFVTPNGLDASDGGGSHGTTARELARIMAYCAWESPEKERFLKITQAGSYQFTDLSGKRQYGCTNHNAFLNMMEGVISGKTGFTSAAGYCYVCAVESEGRKFAGVVLACGWPYNRTYKWHDMKMLMNYGLGNYRLVTPEYERDCGQIPVTGGIASSGNPWEETWVSLYCEPREEELQPVLIREGEKLVCRTVRRSSLEAPVKRDQEAGHLAFYLGEELLFELPLKTAQAVEKRELRHCMLWIFRNYVL